MSSGIKHIEFWAKDLKKSLEFYNKLFPLIGWQKFDKTSFENGDTKIYFIQQDVTFNKNIGPRHICYLADSNETVNKVGVFLKDLNAFIIRGPIESKYKDRSSYTIDFKDPDGYILEVATQSVSNK